MIGPESLASGEEEREGRTPKASTHEHKANKDCDNANDGTQVRARLPAALRSTPTVQQATNYRMCTQIHSMLRTSAGASSD